MPKEKSKSAKYYASNPAARKKKAAYDTEFNKKPAQRKKRSELVTERRRRGIEANFKKNIRQRNISFWTFSCRWFFWKQSI